MGKWDKVRELPTKQNPPDDQHPQVTVGTGDDGKPRRECWRHQDDCPDRVDDPAS